MLRIYNTLTRKIESFESLHNNKVGMYSCGPTVYDYQHIGHMRRYVGDDVLVRILKYNGYHIHHVMNITDVGHLTSDADEGEDKMEKGARKFGGSVWDVARRFEEQFKESAKELNIPLPKDLMHATDYIKEQIQLIQTLEKKGYTYRTQDGIYFDTSKFKDYFKLSRQNPEELKTGARVEFNSEKRNPSDFALWKFDLGRAKSGLPNRAMNWWFEGKFTGELLIKRPASEVDLKEALERWFNASQEDKETIGFPGWHIECSAMSMKALGESFDIHTGGIDHINIHHTNEIAQAEAATGKKFVNFWVHHNFLEVEGQKMSKSLGNFITVQEVMQKGYDPLALRYLYLQTHYRQEMNFTWEALEAAQTSLKKLRAHITDDPLKAPNIAWTEKFLSAVNDDVNTAKALAVVWEMVKDENLFPAERSSTLLEMDKILGLALYKREKIEIPQNILDLVHEREGFRKAGDFAASDEMRKKIRDLGYDINDRREGPEIKKIQ